MAVYIVSYFVIKNLIRIKIMNNVALGKQVRSVWIETLQKITKITKNRSKPQQFVLPQGSSGGVKKIQ